MIVQSVGSAVPLLTTPSRPRDPGGGVAADRAAIHLELAAIGIVHAAAASSGRVAADRAGLTRVVVPPPPLKTHRRPVVCRRREAVLSSIVQPLISAVPPLTSTPYPVGLCTPVIVQSVMLCHTAERRKRRWPGWWRVGCW